MHIFAPELKYRRQILRPVFPRLRFDGKHLSIETVGSKVILQIKDHARTETQRRGVRRNGADLSVTARIDRGIIVRLDATESTGGTERRMTVKPKGGLFHRPVENERPVPHIRIAAMGHLHVRQHQRTFALLDQACSPTEPATRHRTSIIVIIDRHVFRGTIARCRSFHPRRHVEHSHPWFGTGLHCHLRVRIVEHKHLTTVVCRSNIAPIRNLRTPFRGERRRSHGDALQFAQEITQVGRLVVTDGFPHHALPVLMIVPESGDTEIRRVVGRINQQIFPVAYEQFLSPVTKEVTRGAWVVFSPIVHGTVPQEDTPHSGFVDFGLTRRSGAVKYFLAKVAVPIDTEIQVQSRDIGQRLVCRKADDARLAACPLATRIILIELAGQRTPVVTGTLQTVIQFRRGGIPVIHGR